MQLGESGSASTAEAVVTQPSMNVMAATTQGETLQMHLNFRANAPNVSVLDGIHVYPVHSNPLRMCIAPRLPMLSCVPLVHQRT